MTSTMTSKGQVTVPKRLRDYPGLEPGAEVEFELPPEGDVVVRPARRRHARRSLGQLHRLPSRCSSLLALSRV